MAEITDKLPVLAGAKPKRVQLRIVGTSLERSAESEPKGRSGYPVAGSGTAFVYSV